MTDHRLPPGVFVVKPLLMGPHYEPTRLERFSWWIRHLPRNFWMRVADWYWLMRAYVRH